MKRRRLELICDLALLCLAALVIALLFFVVGSWQ